MGSQENHEEAPSQSLVIARKHMQNLVEWGRATRGDNRESEGKRIEKNSSFGRSHGGRSASYDSAGATGSAQCWPSRATWNHDTQTSRRSYGAGAASGSAQSWPMRRGYLHVERADRAFAGYGAPYGRASAGWKSRVFDLEPSRDSSSRAEVIARSGYLGGGSTWVVVAGLGGW